MAMATLQKPYQAQKFDLQGLDGISEEQLEQHYKLYEGYVNNTNKLNENIAELIENGKAGTPEYNELKRRFGFEYCGMRLHEFYFNNMKANGGELPADSELGKKIIENFGSIKNWKTDFINTGMMRGIGWVILYQDPCEESGKRLVNFWVSDHENGHPAGFQPILVMDVWEHAFTVDYQPTEKKKYIEAFFRNVNWQAAESRLR